VNLTSLTNKTQQNLLQTAALALHQALDVNVVLETLLDCLEKFIPYDSASIMLLDGEGFLVILAARGYEQWMPEAHQFKGTAFPVDKASLPIYKIFQNQESALIPDVRQEPGWQSEIAAGAIVRNWIGVPLLAGGRFIGLISLDKLEPNYFTDNHTRLAEQIAVHATLAIQNAQLFQAEQSRSQKLQQAQAILYQADKAAALGRLATTISHEINNPIQAIQGCLDLTREEIDNPEIREHIERYLDIIEAEAQHIKTIINQMRQTYPTTVDYAHNPCDINTLLDAILRDHENQIKAKKIIMLRKWAEDLPLIQVNEQNITKAFQNIIQNAIDILEPGEQLTLETALSPTLSNNLPATIQITIRNSGSLIPTHIQENLFEPFITTKDRQFGLGLFVTYSIIEAHGGQINVTSTAEQGTIFTIHLPIPSPPSTNSPT